MSVHSGDRAVCVRSARSADVLDWSSNTLPQTQVTLCSWVDMLMRLQWHASACTAKAEDNSSTLNTRLIILRLCTALLKLEVQVALRSTERVAHMCHSVPQCEATTSSSNYGSTLQDTCCDAYGLIVTDIISCPPSTERSFLPIVCRVRPISHCSCTAIVSSTDLSVVYAL